MSWPVRSRLLLLANLAAPGANVVHYSGAVPVGKTWLIKDVALWHGGGTASMYLYLESGGVITVCRSYLDIPSGATAGGGGASIVAPAGYRIGWSISTNALSHVVISGAQLG